MLAAAALCGLDAQESEPAVFTYGGMEFTVTGEATAGLSDANKLPEVVIPETVENEGNTYTVTSILEDAFDYNDVTTKVVMPNTITEVAYCGMYGAEAVTELVVSENLRTLGGYAFAYMESLPSIDLPEGITEIPGDCFFMSSALQAIKLPSTVQSIGDGCFYKSGLAEFTFPDACETVGSNVFQGCPNLAKVTFGPNLRTMDEGDYEALCLILQDPEVMYAYAHAFTDEEVRLWLRRQQERYARDGFGLWAVVLKESGTMIGQCGLTLQPCDGRTMVEVGYLFRKAYWHRGYATEAAIACKRHAFSLPGISEVCSIIRDINRPSQAVALRNGMTHRGTFTKHYCGMDMPHYVYITSRAD